MFLFEREEKKEKEEKSSRRLKWRGDRATSLLSNMIFGFSTFDGLDDN